MAASPTKTELQASLANIAEREAESRRAAFEASAWLAAIVDNSNDAILSKTLEGVIMSWNGGAARLFGYTAEEAIGQPVTIIIPDDRLREEDDIMQQLRVGKRVEQFRTVRCKKDREPIDIELTISPVRDANGRVLGASTIARDITPQVRAAERQALLLREMNHRIKNLFALTTALVSMSGRGAKDVDELIADLTARFNALARAHSLTLPDLAGENMEAGETTLVALLEAIFAPHEQGDEPRIRIEGDDTAIGTHALPTFALLLHELATNATKYGGLATPAGRLGVTIATDGEWMTMTWRETGAPERRGEPSAEGFGSKLERASISSLHGTIERSWLDRGLEIALRFPLTDLNR